MQSPFSFRRFAPAFDYLGSPFSAFFRPLLLGFPLPYFRISASSFFRSAFASFRPLFPRFWLLSFLFFFSAFFPVFLTAALRCTSVSFVPSVFPLPSRLISHALLPVLLTQLSCIVSFRPSLLRSRSRSAGAHLSLSLKMSLLDFRFLSSASVLGFQLLSFCSFFSSFPLFRLHSWLSSFSVPLSLSCFSSFIQPGFPCFLSDSKYSAFLFVSFRPSLLHSHSCSTGASLLDFSSGIGA